MRKLPQTAAGDLPEIVMGYERSSPLLTFNRPVDDWGKLLTDVAAVGAMLDRLLPHGHVLMIPLAGFELSLIGCFSGVPRGTSYRFWKAGSIL